MMKYLRDKITGRPAAFSPADDLSLDDNILSMKKTQSQNSLNDVISISINSNSNDITSSDQTISQVEKLTAAAGGHRLIGSSSSPIVIPKKPTRSNASSQSSSSYTSVADQMSSLGESSLQTYRELDDASSTSLPIVSTTCQRLEHSAARDRIAVKNKRRQAIKEKLSTLRETDDNQIDLFSSNLDDEQAIVVPQTESKVQQQPTADLSDLDTARARRHVSVRPRDHSADNIISTTSIVPTYISSVQRSISFKRPQEINESKLINRSIFRIEKKDEEEENKNELGSHSSPSFKEHIYDNLDLFKRHKVTIRSDLISNENESSINNLVKTREHSIPTTTTRLRPVTMHIPPFNDKQTTNEFENVFNQLKKRASIKKDQSKEEIIPVADEPVQTPLPSVSVEETPTTLLTENEPIIPVVVSTNKTVEITSVSQTSNRRRTVGGVHLTANNKVSVDDNKPTPSWIDIAKQKQSKFQSVSIEKNHHEEPEQQQTTSVEPIMVSRKQVVLSSNTAITKENTSEDTRSNRKSMFEPIITRRVSPQIAPTNTHAIERDSIRALKAGNPNRINNLIQFFDK